MQHTDNSKLIHEFEAELQKVKEVEDNYFIARSDNLGPAVKKMADAHVTSSKQISAMFHNLVSSLRLNTLTIELLEAFNVKFNVMLKQANMGEEFVNRYTSTLELIARTKSLLASANQQKPTSRELPKQQTTKHRPGKLSTPEKTQALAELYSAWDLDTLKFNSMLTDINDNEMINYLLQTAIGINDIETVRLVLQKGASISLPENLQQRTYKLADWLGFKLTSTTSGRQMSDLELQILTELLKYKANIHQPVQERRSNSSTSLLRYISERGNYTGAMWLIAAGYDTAKSDWGGLSAEKWSVDYKTVSSMISANKVVTTFFDLLIKLESREVNDDDFAKLEVENFYVAFIASSQNDNAMELLTKRLSLMMQGAIEDPLQEKAWTLLMGMLLTTPTHKLPIECITILSIQGAELAHDKSPFARLFFDKVDELAKEKNLSPSSTINNWHGVPNTDAHLFHDMLRANPKLDLTQLTTNMQLDKKYYHEYLELLLIGDEFYLKNHFYSNIDRSPADTRKNQYYSIGRVLFDTYELLATDTSSKAKILETLIRCFERAGDYRDAKTQLARLSLLSKTTSRITSSIFTQLDKIILTDDDKTPPQPNAIKK